MGKPVVAIVGRPNVGKSTLFNRLSQKKIAIVEDEPGITRDRIYADAEWQGRGFTLVDTGGIDVDATDGIMSAMRRQAELAIAEADCVLFVVDARDGLVPADEEVAELLRATNKPVLLVANKADTKAAATGLYEFYRMGLGEPVAVSAEHGLGLGDLLDLIVKKLPEKTAAPEYPEDTIKVAVIGRPNVGKSSLVNALLGEERVIVSDVPGTTRDAVDTFFTKDGAHYVLIDTAGMRRKARIDLPVERYSILRALRAVDRCDVALIVIDATEGVTEQDKKIAGYAHEAGRASIIVVNKWDLVEKDNRTFNVYTRAVREELEFMQYAPLLFISAKTGQRVSRVTELIQFVADQHAMRIATSVLNELVEEAVALTPPPTEKGQRLKIYYTTQAQVKPPVFIFFVNNPELMHFSYLRYLENKLREAFGFEGTPLKLVVRRRGEM